MHDVLWGPRTRTRRGPKPAKTLAEIVTAAIAVADSDGLAGVSMQRVATELGFTTMALYRYVPGKNELLALMIDTALGAPPELRGTWRERLEHWANLLHAKHQRHPWLVSATARARVMGPHEVGWYEQAVKTLSQHGFGDAQSLAAVRTIECYVRGLSASEGAFDTFADLVRRNASRFPALGAAIEQSPAQLEFGLAVILDGIVLFGQR